MLTRMQYLLLTALGAVSLVLAVVNMIMFTQNRAVQAEVAARSQYVQQALQLRPLHQELVKVLADLAVRRGDDQIRELLAAQGVTLAPATAGAPAGASSAPAAPPAPGGGQRQ